jgi:hypothetical protein
LEFAKKFYARNVTVDLSPVSLNCLMNYQHPYGLIAIHMTCPVKRFTTLARPIPLRLDDLCINTLPLCYRQHQSIPPGQEEFIIRSHSLNRDSACFFEAILFYLLQTQPVEENLPAQISIMELLSTSQVHRAAKG